MTTAFHLQLPRPASLARPPWDLQLRSLGCT